MTRPTRSVLPERVNPGDADEVYTYLVEFLERLEQATGGMLSEPAEQAVSVLTTGVHVAAYTVSTTMSLPDGRWVAVVVELTGTAQAGRVRLQLVDRFGGQPWAWHFDPFHLDLGGWGHEHHSAGPPVLSDAQNLDAALIALVSEIWGLEP